MNSLNSFLQAFVIFALAGLQITTASVIPSEETKSLHRRFITPNSFGTHGGFFYNWWSDGFSPIAEYTNTIGGEYTWVDSLILPYRASLTDMLT